MRSLKLAIAIGGTVLVTGIASSGVAMAQDAAFGRDVWTSQANCADCHGSMGDGNADDPRSPPGANLRETGLDEATLIEVILCGIPGTAMPHFDHRAYEDDRCYGMTREEM
nr:c-type cytochrome [Devosia sp.]